MLPRHLLPQIPNDEIDNFKNFVNSEGISSKIVYLPVKTLTPIQKHLSSDKVYALQKKLHELGNPILISKDNIIMDGHHRWAATLAANEANRIICLKFACSIKKLIELGHMFDGSEVKTVHEVSYL